MAYLYRHIRLDNNVPFYIGIGSDEKYSRANSSKNRNNYWNKIVDKTDYEVEILFEDDDYEFIKEKEIEFIKLYGRKDIGKGTLCNLTNGGDGCLGLIHSDDSKLKMSIPNKGKAISKEQRNKVSLFHKGKVLSQAHKDKISLANSGINNPMYGKKFSIKHIENQVKSAKRGEDSKSSKLTDNDVISIRTLHLNNKYSHKKLSEIFSVSRGNITSILNRNSWKHI